MGVGASKMPCTTFRYSNATLGFVHTTRGNESEVEMNVDEGDGLLSSAHH